MVQDYEKVRLRLSPIFSSAKWTARSILGSLPVTLRFVTIGVSRACGYLLRALAVRLLIWTVGTSEGCFDHSTA